MTAIVDTLSTENLIIFAFMIYLLGVATPVILLRAIAQNHQDTCFLTVILWGIVMHIICKHYIFQIFRFPVTKSNNPIAESVRQSPNPSPDLSTSKLVSISILTRLLVDTGVQLFNPFLSIIAKGLGIDFVALGQLVSLRSLMGLLAPLFGAQADRRGYRNVLRASLYIGAVGVIIIGLSWEFWHVVIGMILWGIGLAAFAPTLQAYMSARLPYARRARVIGIVEYAWALAGIVGLYSIGWLIQLYGWRTPFFVLGGGMGIAGLFFGLLPSARNGAQQKSFISPLSEQIQDKTSLAEDMSLTTQSRVLRSWSVIVRFFQLGSNARSAYANMIGGTFLYFGAMQVFAAYGVWLANEYHLPPSSLGTVALLLGFADLCGSVLVSLITDRFGKRRSVIVGGICAAIGFLLMPILNVNIALAVLSIALARGCFEFAIVSNISLISEQVPAQRGKVMALSVAINLVGTTVAATSGPWLYQGYDVWGLSVVSAFTSFIGLVIYWSMVKESGEMIDC
ncbi:MFS transporter [Chloroflexi bacterium TSY]|nr:MFS transporter [Chloroflexi bacterium TSY]